MSGVGSVASIEQRPFFVGSTLSWLIKSLQCKSLRCVPVCMARPLKFARFFAS
jgi:hypothetical protein